MKNMKFIKRAFLALLATLLLAATLVSCGGSGEGALDTSRLENENDAVTYFSRILNINHSKAKDAKAKFIAAFRGYDASSKSFDDTKVELGSAISVNVTAAKAALKAINAEKATQIDDLTAGQIVEVYFYCLQDATKFESTDTKNDGLPYVLAASVRAASEDARNSFNAAVKFAPANDIDASADALPTFQLAEGFELATNLEAAKKALKIDGMRPTGETDAAKYDEWVNNLDEAQLKLIVIKLRAEADLATDGFPGIILVWVGKFLGILTKYLSFNNYVVGLFWFAIIVEILLIFFSIKQQKNSIKQAKLSPKERAIRNKYKGRNDQPSMQKMQEEIQKLYQEEGFNPMGGCLPLLIQMPVLIALYQVVIDPLHYVLGMGAQVSGYLGTYAQTLRAAGGLGITAAANKGTIELLSSIGSNFAPLKSFSYFSNAVELHDAVVAGVGGESFNFNFLGLATGSVPSFNSWLIIVPILTFVAYFFSMKVTRKLSYQPATQDPQMGMSNKIMDLTMPLMSAWFAFVTPAAIGIYWIFKCLLGMLKQLIMAKAMPLPKFTEEDYKQAEKELKNRSKNKKEPAMSVANDGRVYRSLHHIDDEDDLPPKGSIAPAKEEVEDEDDTVTEEVKVETNAAPAADERPRLKEDRKNNKKN